MLLIKGGHIYDSPSAPVDILIENEKIAEVSENIHISKGMEIVDVSGLIIAPGLVDMHVHFRDPGYEYKEDILSGASAAAAGGITTCCCMPNTLPVADNEATIRYIAEIAKHASARVLPYGAVTVGQKGEALTDFALLYSAGAVALSDDGNPIQSACMMRDAMRKAALTNSLIISHCEDAEMVDNFAVNEGRVSRELGIQGRPAIAEVLMVARDVMLAAITGARVHIAHVSTEGSVEIIRRAKAAGTKVTAETCPQYFSLTEDEILRQGAIARMNPPLRTTHDVDAIIQGLEDGTIDVIATDHAPHSAKEKSKPLQDAPSGITGLETSLALTLTYLYHTGRLSLERIIGRMSRSPAGILALETGTLEPGAAADIVVFDPDEEWTVDPAKFKSKARSSPFAGMNLRGKVKLTICRGKIVYSGGNDHVV